MQQISFRREPLKDRHGYPTRTLARGILIRFFPFRVCILAVIFKNELGKKERAFEIGQRITETLRGVHSAQSFKIRRVVFAYAHGTG